jgi:formylglycine-generating enzyme required for sulfatase activity
VSSSPTSVSPETVEITPRVFIYRVAGDFHLAGRPVDAPKVRVAWSSTVLIMKRQVSGAEYNRCVASRKCKQTSPNAVSTQDFPAVNLSWDDATAYATWSFRAG